MALSWLHRLLKWKPGPVSRPGGKQFGANRFVPTLEALDDRIVPAVFHVTTLADGGAGSLRDAVSRANAHPGADVITFQSGLTGTIALAGGEFDIMDDLTINGPGADRLTVSGNHVSRVFKVEAGETVSISGLTIAGGNAGAGNGGGIDNFGALTVSDSMFSGNSAANGGGIDNEDGATATVTGSTLTGNSPHVGGGIDVDGTVTVRGSTFTGNHAALGGGLNTEFGGTATVSGSTFTGNSGLFGGGIYLEEGSRLTLRDSTLASNSAGGNGGGLQSAGTLTVIGSTFTLNTSTIGGGLDNEFGATATVIGSTFTGNSATQAGGIDNVGTLTLGDSTLASNSAPLSGGGMFNP